MADEYIAIMWNRKSGYHLIGAGTEQLRFEEIDRIRDRFGSRVTNLYGPVPQGTFEKANYLMETLAKDVVSGVILLEQILAVKIPGDP